MHTAKCLFDTAAGVNPIRSSMKLPIWARRVKRKNLAQLRTTTSHPLPLYGWILLHLRLGKLRSRIWFEVAPFLAVEILSATSFIGRFVRGSILLEQEEVSRHSQSVAKLAYEWTWQNTRISKTVSRHSIQAVDHNVCHEADYNVVGVPRQIGL